MISVLFFDLGDTLVVDGVVLPNVPQGLKAISEFTTADGQQLRSALVSDYLEPDPPRTPAKIQAIFEQYLALLDGFHLREFFEPVDQRVTLSTQAGVRKPDRRIFETALRRLGVNVPFSDCLFVTEDRGHIAACKKLGLSTLRFDNDHTGGDFSDWSEAPLLIAHFVAPESKDAVSVALSVRLPVSHDVMLAGITNREPDGLVDAQVLTNYALPGSAAHPGVQVRIPVPATISFDAHGRIRDVHMEGPSAEAIAEAAHYVKGLEANRQIANGSESLLGQTHKVEPDGQGRPVLKRKRYSAI